jgi:ZIP family zinc transporter
MPDVLLAIFYGLFAGLMIPAGGYLASIERIQPNWLEEEVRHSVIAFGGGILVSAVAFVLVPEALDLLPLWAALLTFFAGGAVFALLEHLQKQNASKNAQFIAMLTDFVPEAASLGAMMAARTPEAALLAFLIGAQNLPEAFNAWRELQAGDHPVRRIMRIFLTLSLLGPAAVLLGYFFLADQPLLTGAIMMTAAGGILFLTFQDIAVKAHLEYRQAPSLAALFGFALGMVGHALVTQMGG